MPTIETRISLNHFYNTHSREYIAFAHVDGEVLAQVTQKERRSLLQNLNDKVEAFLKEWPTCDQTLTSEPKYRKTIISSCGQLTVIESLK